ncbi:MAG: hypothetical protein CME70_00810 [Halobacteriovorax sp.]|nr:hypothetical protein [Halobacteriovorax sp.]
MAKKLESTANLIVLDLITEGEIAGLCDQNGELVSGRGRPGRQGYFDSKGKLSGQYDKMTGQILDEERSSSNPYRYKGIYLNDTPVITTPKGPAALGREQVNFRRFYSEIRFGHQDQKPLNLMGSQNTISIQSRLIGPLASTFSTSEQLSESSSSVFHTVTNINVTEVIVSVKIDQLFKVESVHQETLGDMKDSEIEFFIEYGIEGEPLRSFRGEDHVPSEYTLGKAPIKIKGVATSPYFVDFVIRIGDQDYDSGITGKPVKGLSNPYKKHRVIKLTRATREKDPEETASETDDTADHTRSMSWESVVEVIPENFSYANSVIAASQFDARYFSRIHERSFDCKLLKVPIPNNYDPENRRYKGHWDGRFSTEDYSPWEGQKGKYWTDNPAWIFNDLMTNRRYGVGKFLDPDFDPAAQVDKWNLYEISKISDEIVLTGSAPRHGWTEFVDFTNNLKKKSDNYIEFTFKGSGANPNFEDKFGNSALAETPNLKDYAGQELVIKTCDGNIYKRKIVSSSIKTTTKSSSKSFPLYAAGERSGSNKGISSPITIGGLEGGMLKNTGCDTSGRQINEVSDHNVNRYVYEQHWVMFAYIGHGDRLRGVKPTHGNAFSGNIQPATHPSGFAYTGGISETSSSTMRIENGDLKYTSQRGSGWISPKSINRQVGKDKKGSVIHRSSTWPGNNTEDRFVGPAEGAVGTGGGIWCYAFEFDLEGFDKGTVQAHLKLRSDNAAYISTNGRNIKKIPSSWTTDKDYPLRPQDLQPGLNVIYLALENSDSGAVGTGGGSNSGNLLGFQAKWYGSGGTGSPKAKVSATGDYKSFLATGELDHNWALSSNIVNNSALGPPANFGHRPKTYNFERGNFAGWGAPFQFLSPSPTKILPAIPKGDYIFMQTFTLTGDPAKASIKFDAAARNLRPGDSFKIQGGAWGPSAPKGWPVGASLLPAITDNAWVPCEFSASDLGWHKGVNTLFIHLHLKTDYKIGSPPVGNSNALSARAPFVPAIGIRDIKIVDTDVLGYEQEATVTVDGGLLENEMSGADVCGEAAVRFQGDYEVAEPRFACNILITDKTEAIDLLKEMASVFRGMLYFANGMTFLTTDIKKEPVTLFTNANTQHGNFSYSGSPKTSRHSVCLVRYNDKEDAFRPKIEYVEDPGAINKFGYIEKEVIAFGCTSRGQARRLGEWALLTAQLEREAINFKAGLEASFLKPGDVFKVIDKNRTIKRFWGRVFDVETDGKDSAIITLDSKIQDKLSHKKLTVITPKKNENVRTLDDLAASRRGSLDPGLSMEDIANSREAQITTFEFDPVSDRSEILEINQNKVILNPSSMITRMNMGEMQHGRFGKWDGSKNYKKGELIKYKGIYYECIKDHKSSMPYGGKDAYWQKYKAVDIHSVLLEIPVGSIWILECEDENISTQSHLYRTLQVKEAAMGEFEVSGLEYIPNKFDVIEKKAKLDLVKPLPAYSYYGSLPNASLGIEVNTG